MSSTYRRGSSDQAPGSTTITVKEWSSESLRRLFAAYYSLDPPLILPRDMARREFAIQPFDVESYVRHLSFKDEQSLRKYIRSRTPRHLYHSVAIYELPEAPTMEEKGWLGSELLFDLDLDHPGSCSSSMLDDECLLEGFKKARLVAKIVEDILGGRALIYFTGHRGFHVRGKCDDCMTLGKDERTEIAKLVRAEGLDVKVLFPRNARAAKPLPDDPGWRGLAASLGLDLRSSAEGIGVDIDSMVTSDPSRLTRVPGSLNAKGGLLVVPLCDSFRPSQALSPFRGQLDVKAIKQVDEASILGYRISLSADEEAELPASVAIYLHLNGYVKIEGGEVSVRRDTGWWPVQGCDWTP